MGTNTKSQRERWEATHLDIATGNVHHNQAVGGQFSQERLIHLRVVAQRRLAALHLVGRLVELVLQKGFNVSKRIYMLHQCHHALPGEILLEIIGGDSPVCRACSLSNDAPALKLLPTSAAEPMTAQGNTVAPSPGFGTVFR